MKLSFLPLTFTQNPNLHSGIGGSEGNGSVGFTGRQRELSDTIVLCNGSPEVTTHSKEGVPAGMCVLLTFPQF